MEGKQPYLGDLSTMGQTTYQFGWSPKKIPLEPVKPFQHHREGRGKTTKKRTSRLLSFFSQIFCWVFWGNSRVSRWMKCLKRLSLNLYGKWWFPEIFAKMLIPQKLLLCKGVISPNKIPYPWISINPPLPCRNPHWWGTKKKSPTLRISDWTLQKKQGVWLCFFGRFLLDLQFPPGTAEIQKLILREKLRWEMSHLKNHYCIHLYSWVLAWNCSPWALGVGAIGGI